MVKKDCLEFEARLSYDLEFKTYYDNYCKIETDIKNHFERESLKKKLKESDVLIDKKEQKHLKVKYIRNVSIGLAAGIALVFGVYLNGSSHDKLVSELWPYEEGLPVKMGQFNPYHKPMNAFKLGKWNESIALLESFESDTAHYFIGLSHYQLNHFEKSKSYLGQVAESSVYFEDAVIRISLLEIIEGNKENAKELLVKIVTNKSHKHYDLARRILNKI
jgi:hypothetical protein